MEAGMRKIGMVAMAGALMLAFSAPAALGALSLDSPQATFNTWMDQMEQNVGKHEYVRICYSERRLREIKEKTKDPAGVRRMDGYHAFLVSEMAKYNPSEPEMVSDTEAVITLTPKAGGKTAEVRLVLEGDSWKVDMLPEFGSERGLGGYMLVIVAVVCAIIILVLAKKVLLT